MYRIDFDNGKYIRVSKDHRLKSPQGFIQVTDLLKGDAILSKDSICNITNITKEASEETLYDPVSVGLGNEYYSNGVISHNCADFLGLVALGDSGRFVAGAGAPLSPPEGDGGGDELAGRRLTVEGTVFGTV